MASVLFLFLLATVLAMFFPRQLEHVGQPPSIDSVHIFTSALGLGIAPSLPITLIKVDERSFSAWGRPYPMAKTRLAALVEVIRGLGPRAILVDFDFSIHRNAADTAAFEHLLLSWTSADPPLLLPADLVLSADGQASRTPSVLELHPNGAPVFWTSVMFRKDGGRRVREWRLWEYSCDTSEVFLSPQLIVSAITQGGAAEVNRVREALAAAATCGLPAPESLSPVPDWLGNTIAISPINYVFGREGQPYNDSAGRPLLTEWSAIDVLEKGLAASAVADRTVIIGSSRADSGDNHLTPIGEMEGMRIIANAVATAPDVLDVRTPSVLESLILLLVPTGLAILLLKRLKLVFSGAAILAVTVVFYAIASRLYGPSNGIGALSWSATLVAIFFFLESILQFLSDLLLKRSGWQAFLNRE